MTIHHKIFWAALITALPTAVFAQSHYPSKPIRIIVPSIAGSAPDVRVRQISPKLGEALGQPVVVDNRPGAFPGEFNQAHGIAVDSKGNVYVSENRGRRIHKFRMVSE